MWCGLLAQETAKRLGERLLLHERIGVERLIEAEKVFDRRIHAAVAGLHANEVIGAGNPIVTASDVGGFLVKASQIVNTAD